MDSIPLEIKHKICNNSNLNILKSQSLRSLNKEWKEIIDYNNSKLYFSTYEKMIYFNNFLAKSRDKQSIEYVLRLLCKESYPDKEIVMAIYSINQHERDGMKNTFINHCYERLLYRGWTREARWLYQQLSPLDLSCQVSDDMLEKAILYDDVEMLEFIIFETNRSYDLPSLFIRFTLSKSSSMKIKSMYVSLSEFLRH
jgi:hypothetical protein